MSNLLRQLENNEAALMMYLAGELPREDRVEVDEMLQRDPALRAQFAELRRLLERTADDFALDSANGAASASAEAARQRLQPVIRQWATDRLVRPAPVSAAAAHRPAPWFLYPLIGTAAALVLVAVILSQLEPAKITNAPQASYAYIPDWQELQPANLNVETPQATAQAEALIASLEDADPLNTATTDRLTVAATELHQIKQLADAMETGEDVTFLQ